MLVEAAEEYITKEQECTKLQVIVESFQQNSSKQVSFLYLYMLYSLNV